MDIWKPDDYYFCKDFKGRSRAWSPPSHCSEVLAVSIALQRTLRHRFVWFHLQSVFPHPGKLSRPQWKGCFLKPGLSSVRTIIHKCRDLNPHNQWPGTHPQLRPTAVMEFWSFSQEARETSCTIKIYSNMINIWHVWVRNKTHQVLIIYQIL